MSENDIAIVGMAGRFPGAGNVREFWENLRSGTESVKIYDLNELKEAGVPLQLLEDDNYVPASAPLEAIDMFDAGLFGISPGDAMLMNPQLRLMLECAWEALDDACIDSIHEGAATGVFVGGSSNDYILPLILNEIAALHSQNSLRWGIWNDNSFLATRISYHLNLGGPSLTVQTACSTALVCVHQACSALLSGDCNVALAGAASVTLLEKRGYLFRREGIMSKNGHCRPFDQDASGTVEGNGVGLVVLKRLDDALEHRNSIRAIIKASRVNNDGNVKLGFSAPSAKAQAAVIRGALRDAGVQPQEIIYIEAHGTGTVLGDAIELEALNDVFTVGESKPQRFLGSVKGNIGHLDAAAGIAGLIKASLILEHRHIPPTMVDKQQGSEDQRYQSGFACNRSGVELSQERPPVFVGVSSFGIGGTNAHAVLAHRHAAPITAGPPAPQVIALSAKSEAALQSSIRNLAFHMRENENVCVADVAFSLRKGRRHLPFRCAVVAETRTEAIEVLESRPSANAGKSNNPLILYFSNYRVASLRPWQTLFQRDSVFREFVTRSLGDASLRAGIVDLTRLFRVEDFGDALWDAWRGTTEVEMLLSTVIQLSVAETWMAFGSRPARFLSEGSGAVAANALVGRSFLKRPTADDHPRAGGGHGGEYQIQVLAADLSAAFDATEIESGLRDCDVRDAGGVMQIKGPAVLIDKWLDALDARRVNYLPEVGTPSTTEDRQLFDLAMSAWQGGNVATELRKVGVLEEMSDGNTQIVTDRELAGIHGTLLLVGGVSEASLPAPIRDNPSLEVLGIESISGSECEKALLNSWARLWMQEKLPGSAPIWAPSARARLISLPSYPFERKSFWLAERKSIVTDQPASAPVGGDTEQLCYTITWEKEPLGYQNGSDGRLAVTAHPSFPGLAAAIARVSPRIKVIEVDDLTHAPAEQSKDAITQRLLAALEDGDHSVPRILYGRTLFPSERDTGLRVRFEKFLDGEFNELICNLKVLSTIAAGRDVRLIVPCNGVAKILKEDVVLPERAHLLGLVQATRREYPGIRACLVDVEVKEDGTVTDQVAECLAYEALSNHDELIVGYRAGERYSRRFRHCDFANGASPAAVQDGATYLITGGLGGVGSQLASCLAERKNIRLVLMTRPAKRGAPPLDNNGTNIRNSADTSIARDNSPASDVQIYDELLDDALARRQELLGGLAQNRSEWIRRFEKLSFRKTAAMLRNSLAHDSARRTWTTRAIVDRLEVQPAYERLLFSVLDQLHRYGEINLENSSIAFPHLETHEAGEESEMKGGASSPEASAACELIDEALTLFPKVVRGDLPAREALRSGTGGNMLWDKARELSAYSLLPWYLHVATDWLRRCIESDRGRMIRVLEVGGGTGAITNSLLKLAAKRDFTYCFTDVSLGQVERMRRLQNPPDSRFSYETLDLNQDIVEQGFTPMSYDVVVAYNSLHLAKDIKATIAYLAKVVRPGGFLLILENCRERIWNTLSWGLLPEYWSATEGFRASSPLLDMEGWRNALESAGLKWVWGFSKDENLNEKSDLALMVYEFPALRLVETTPSNETSVKAQRVAQLESQGATVEVVECDVADTVAVRDCIQRLTAKYGPIRGLIHAAGTPEASLIESLTTADICAQLRAKVFGTITLLEHLDLEFLDFIVFCSAAERPNALAQTCYVGANRFMDNIAESLQSGGHKAVSIGWDRWQGTGMADAVEKAHKQVTGKELGGGMTPEQGKAIFRRIMQSIPAPYVLVAGGSPDGREEAEIRIEERHSTADAAPKTVTMEGIVQDLSILWTRVLGVESLDPEANILELGGHSLITTQVVNAMHAKHPKADLKLRDVYDNPTVASLAEVIWQRCSLSGSGKVPVPLDADHAGSPFLAILLNGRVAHGDQSMIADAETLWTIKKKLNFIVYPHELSQFRSTAQATEYLERERALQNSLRTTPEWANPEVIDALAAQRCLSMEAESTRLERIAFLISSPRSGSTLLKSMLGAHPALTCPPELNLLLHDTLDTLVHSLTGPLVRQSLARTFTELLRTKNDIGDGLVEALVARKARIAEVYRILQALAKPALILDKCPNYSLDPRIITRAEALFSKPRYIVLTRHPVAVIESFVRNRMHRLYTLDHVHPVWFAKEVFQRSLQTTLWLRRSIEASRVHVVRFEDLVCDPEGTTAQIFEFLDVAPQPMLSMPLDRFSGSVSDPDFLRHDSIESTKSNDWRQLSPPFAIDEAMSNMAALLGYET